MAEKSNEITEIPLLLRRLELKGAFVAIDAMGTQKEIAQTIVDGGGDYVLALKENWPATFEEVEKVFADPPPDLKLERFETVDGDRGRIEIRRHTVCHRGDWLFSDRRFPVVGQFECSAPTLFGYPGQATEWPEGDWPLLRDTWARLQTAVARLCVPANFI